FPPSVTTTHRQPCWLPPVGAWVARSRHSSITSAGTGLSRSSRLRTARVVVSSSSTDLRSITLLQFVFDDLSDFVRIHARVIVGVHLDQNVGLIERDEASV